jgi:nicotinamide-nucleotide adenylyltransferase
MSPSRFKTENQSGEEVVACFKEEDFPKFHTGKIASLIFPQTRKKAHLNGDPHIITRVYAFSPKGNILVQKRAEARDSFPGYFTDSASGHLRYHPNISYEYIEQEAWREMKEEMGTDILWGKLWDINFEQDHGGEKELAYNFLAIVEDKISPDSIETGPGTKFYSPNELQTLLNCQKFVPIARKYWNFVLSQKLVEKTTEEYFQTLSSVIANQTPDSRSSMKSAESLEIAALVGRFQPFHIGHLKLITAILQQHDYVKIAVGSSQYSNTPENPFSYEERKIMIERSLAAEGVNSKKYNIFPVPDLHNMTRWADSLFRILGQFDIFYSNNDWIRQIMLSKGKTLGASLKFDFLRLNGTKIRQLIANNESIKDFVPESVIQYLSELNAKSRLLE